MEALLDTMLATVDPGDEVVLTDPTYAGLVNRVRLAGATPRFVPPALSRVPGDGGLLKCQTWRPVPASSA